MEVLKIKQYHLSKGVTNSFVDLVQNVLAASLCSFDQFSNCCPHVPSQQVKGKKNKNC